MPDLCRGVTELLNLAVASLADQPGAFNAAPAASMVRLVELILGVHLDES